jgi:ketosteroid isomerase-like protein
VSENLDLVRSIVEAWERGDFSSLVPAHPELEFVIPDGPDPGSWTGVAAIADAMRARLAAWNEFRWTAENYIRVDPERVLVLGRGGGRGKTSGLDVDQIGAERAILFHIRAGKVTRIVNYMDRRHAFADLGLEE